MGGELAGDIDRAAACVLVEEERLDRQRERRESTPAWRRAKWQLFGRDEEDKIGE